MSSLESQSEDSRRETILRYVIKAAKANLSISDSEMVFLKDLCIYLNISEEDLHLYLREVDDYIDIPQDEQSRMEILYYLFFIIRSDGNIDQSESDFLYEAGLKLGFRPQFIANAISILQRYKDKSLPPDALLAEAKKFMN